MNKNTIRAVMAYRPEDVEDGWNLLEHLKNTKSREGKPKATARLTSIILRLRTGGLPPAESYCLNRLEATCPEDLDLKFALLVAMITKAYEEAAINSNDTAAIGQNSVLANCSRARFLPEGDFPLKLNSACPL